MPGEGVYRAAVNSNAGYSPSRVSRVIRRGTERPAVCKKTELASRQVRPIVTDRSPTQAPLAKISGFRRRGAGSYPQDEEQGCGETQGGGDRRWMVTGSKAAVRTSGATQPVECAYDGGGLVAVNILGYFTEPVGRTGPGLVN